MKKMKRKISAIVMTAILMLTFIYPVSANTIIIEKEGTNYRSQVYGYSSFNKDDETYDLTEEKDTELVLVFNGTETMDLTDVNFTYINDFWKYYVPDFTNIQNDTIWNILETHWYELEGKNLTAVVSSWGYPNNFIMTVVTEEGNFNYCRTQTLPQPDGFMIMSAHQSFTFKNETDTEDVFQYFRASYLWSSNPELRTELITNHEITTHSEPIDIVFKVVKKGTPTLPGYNTYLKEMTKAIIKELVDLKPEIDKRNKLIKELTGDNSKITKADIKLDKVFKWLAWLVGKKYTSILEDGEGDKQIIPPIPELPTIALFSIGLLVLTGYVVLRRKDGQR